MPKLSPFLSFLQMKGVLPAVGDHDDDIEEVPFDHPLHSSVDKAANVLSHSSGSWRSQVVFVNEFEIMVWFYQSLRRRAAKY